MEWLQLTQWVVYLVLAMFALVRGADTFVTGARQMGASLGMSRFAIGVLIVGFGTSLPELASSLAAVFNGATEIVVANVVGSNITNILLIVGFLAAFGGRIIIKRDLIKTELPLFFIATAQLVFAISDGSVERLEALLMIGTFAAYIWYLFTEARDEDMVELQSSGRRPQLEAKSIAFIVLGIVAVLVGAHFAVEMVVNVATLISIPLALVSMAAIALGTSLPEFFVSWQAIKVGEQDIAIGNIFGSNAFNALVVIGLPGLVAPLVVDAIVLDLGLQILLVASAVFFVNGLARQIMRWEGVMMLLFFVFFIIKLGDFM